MDSKDKFIFKTTAKQHKPAIWFRLRGRDAIIYPRELYSMLWGNESDYWISFSVKARCGIFAEEVDVSYTDRACNCFYEMAYERESFIGSAIQALKELCQWVLQGKETAYHKFTENTAKSMLEGLVYMIVPRCSYQTLQNEVKTENFSFKFLAPYACDTPFEIRIGRRIYESYLSDWSTDFNRIRMAMEKFVYYSWMEGSKIELHFEDSPTILCLRPRTLHSNENVLCTTITPDEFSTLPIVFGWCKSRQVMHALYLGLLELFIVDTTWFEEDPYAGDWTEFRLKSYNQLQSCVVENFINGIKEDEQTTYPRNRIIHTVKEMMDDYQFLKDKLKS